MSDFVPGTMKLVEEDNGNCRVYYRKGKSLFCWQEDSPGRFVFYVCSRDGEPSHEALQDITTPLPKGETRTGLNLRNFLEHKRAVAQMSRQL